jgi:type IV/VI secretion system ImpK/VasF family protein
MNLLEICEPIFLYICVLSRIAKLKERGAGYDYETVRSTVEKMFAEFPSKAPADFHSQEQVRKIELPLIFFVDSFISESNLSFAGQWNSERLAFKRNEHAGDEKFFQLLDGTLQEHTLKDKSAEAVERLGVFYVCLGLGFRGIHADKPQRLRQYLDDIGRLLSPSMDRNWDEEIIKEQWADQTNLVEPPSRKLVLIGILFLCLTFATMVTYVWMFREGSRSLATSITQIVNNEGQ